ncbi:MAG: hypothetical protein VW270_16975, partial [Candidatus Poseidoniales archaeon]
YIMAKLNYKTNHSRYLGNMNNDYWTTPKQGFDKTWHSSQAKAKQFAQGISQGKHGSHELDVELTPQGTHAGKIVCKTCNKWVAWIPKNIINT